MSLIKIYSDGACSNNPGKGGLGYIIKTNTSTESGSMGFEFTTNNRMELMGVIIPLLTLRKSSHIIVYTDSKYVVDSINKGWIWKWEKEEWKNRPNTDLWKKIILLLKKHTITFEWIKGHNSHPENEQCDKMAVKARQQPYLLKDSGYEKR